jgi:hypothetical protein
MQRTAAQHSTAQHEARSPHRWDVTQRTSCPLVAHQRIACAGTTERRRRSAACCRASCLLPSRRAIPYDCTISTVPRTASLLCSQRQSFCFLRRSPVTGRPSRPGPAARIPTNYELFAMAQMVEWLHHIWFAGKRGVRGVTRPVPSSTTVELSWAESRDELPLRASMAALIDRWGSPSHPG